MRGLIRHHGVIRGLPKPAAVAAAVAALGLNLLMFDAAQRGDLSGLDRSGLLEMAVLLGGLGILAVGDAGVRSPVWARPLPLPARPVWTAHLRALVLAVSVLVAAMAAVVVGLGAGLRALGYRDFVGPDTLLLFCVRPWLVLLAVALVLAGWRADLADPGRATGWRKLRWTLAVAAPVLLAALLAVPRQAAVAPVVAAAVWACRRRRTLPPALVVAERPAAEAAGGTRLRAPVADGRRVVHKIVARQLFKWPLNWIVAMPVILALGLAHSGILGAVRDADFARYFNSALTVYILVVFVGHFLENLHRVDHLPIPRGLLLRWLMLPGIVTLLVGALGGAVVAGLRAPGESLVYENDAGRRHHGLLVPPDAWRPVWGEAPATVRAPWGEEQPAHSVPVVAGWPLRLWKPYTAGPGASAEFVAWQISRAVADIHGVELTPELIADRYLSTDAAGTVQVREGGLSLVADGLVPPRGPVGPVLPLQLGAVVAGALLLAALICRSSGPGATRGRVRVVFWTVMGGLMAAHIGGYSLLMSRTVQDWVVPALVVRGAGRLGALGPAGWAVAWVLAVAAAVLAWRLCARVFDRVEAVRVRPTRGG